MYKRIFFIYTQQRRKALDMGEAELDRTILQAMRMDVIITMIIQLPESMRLLANALFYSWMDFFMIALYLD